MDNEDLYLRHKNVEMKIPNEIFVVGCGGTGTWVSILGAMMGVNIIHLADHDILENHNMSRLPYSEEDVGNLKTKVLKDFIKNIRPDCSIYTYEGIHNETDLLMLTGEVIFDCNDNAQIQDMIYKYCKENKLRYISVGCNANHFTVINNLDTLFRSDEVSPYQITPMFVVPAVVAACCSWWNIIKQKDNIHQLKSISEIFER